MNRREFLRRFVMAVGTIPFLPVLFNRPSKVQFNSGTDVIILKEAIDDVVYRTKKMQWILDRKPEVVDHYRLLLNSLEE